METPLDEILSDQETPPVEDEKAAVEAQEDQPQEVEDAPEKEADSEETPGDQGTEVAEEAPKSIPLATFLDQRDELKTTKARLAELEKTQAEKPDFGSIFAAPELGERPDAFDNPEGFADHQSKTMQVQQRQSVQQQSYIYAKRFYGEQETDGALTAFGEAMKVNPLLGQAAQQSADPVGEIVEWHKKQQTMDAIAAAGGLEKYNESLRAEWVKEQANGGTQETQAATEQATEKPAGDLPTEGFTAGGGMPKEKPFNEPSLTDIFDS